MFYIQKFQMVSVIAGNLLSTLEVINIVNQFINKLTLRNFFLSGKFVGNESNNLYENLNVFCSSNNLYPD